MRSYLLIEIRDEGKGDHKYDQPFSYPILGMEVIVKFKSLLIMQGLYVPDDVQDGPGISWG